MPIKSSKTEESTRYGYPILGRVDERLSERLDVSELDGTDLVDDNGWLKPGAVLRLDSQLLLPISGGGQEARGIIFEPIKVAKSNSTTDLDSADDVDVVVAVFATVDRAIVEHNLGRSLSANEVSAIEASKRLVLTDPET